MRLKIGVAAAILAAGATIMEYGTGIYVDRLGSDSGELAWLPQLETTGQTVLAYLWVSRAIGFGLAVVGVAALGYWAGRRVALPRESRTIIGSLAVGGSVGHLIGMMVFVTLIAPSGSPFFEGTGLGELLILLGVAIATAIQFSLIGFAGAALAEFDVFDGRHRPDPVADAGAHPDSE